MSDPLEHLVRPSLDCGTAVLVLAGSSGALETDRCDVLAAHGATALTIRWFGGPGQQPGAFEVPVETFTAALDRLAALAPDADRLAVVGSSFGAEAALVTASLDPRVDAVVALAPSSVVWAGVDERGRQTSHWTHRGRPLPFAPFDDSWTADTDPPSYRRLYEQSLRRHAEEAAAAAIAVERIVGDVVLVAGEDDQVWPAADFARAVAGRRASHGLTTALVVHPDAGHRVVLPGETPVERGRAMARGGSPEADAALGRQAWPHVVRALHLREERHPVE